MILKITLPKSAESAVETGELPPLPSGFEWGVDTDITNGEDISFSFSPKLTD